MWESWADLLAVINDLIAAKQLNPVNIKYDIFVQYHGFTNDIQVIIYEDGWRLDIQPNYDSGWVCMDNPQDVEDTYLYLSKFKNKTFYQ